VYIGSSGIVGKKGGAVTFSLDNAGNATFGGNVVGGQFTTGAYTGYAWPAINNYGTYLGPSGLLIGNANNNKYLQVTHDGNIYAPGFSIVNGNATFGGKLTAAAIDAVNTINIAGNAVTTSNSTEGTAPSFTLSVPGNTTSRITLMCKVKDSGTYSEVDNIYLQYVSANVTMKIGSFSSIESGVFSTTVINDHTNRVYRKQSFHMFVHDVTNSGSVAAAYTISVTQGGAHIPITSSIILSAFALFK